MTHTAFYELQTVRQLLYYSIHSAAGNSAVWSQAGWQVRYVPCLSDLMAKDAGEGSSFAKGFYIYKYYWYHF